MQERDKSKNDPRILRSLEVRNPDLDMSSDSRILNYRCLHLTAKWGAQQVLDFIHLFNQ